MPVSYSLTIGRLFLLQASGKWIGRSRSFHTVVTVSLRPRPQFRHGTLYMQSKQGGFSCCRVSSRRLGQAKRSRREVICSGVALLRDSNRVEQFSAGCTLGVRRRRRNERSTVEYEWRNAPEHWILARHSN